MKKIVVILIELYRKYISPFLGLRCRFIPSCSEYSRQAFIKYGFFKGFFLTLKRILKCNPLFKGGYDPLI